MTEACVIGLEGVQLPVLIDKIQIYQLKSQGINL
jgi:hypothetical protein